jgi:hypothetical protein
MNSTLRRTARALPVRAAGFAFAAVTTALVMVAPASAATTFTQSLDVNQGLAFQPTRPSSFGVVTALTIGSLTLTPDLVSTDPTQSPVAPLNAVGILSSDAWAGSAGNPLELSFQMSSTNRQALLAYLQQPLPNTTVNFSFRSYSYDPLNKRWFQSFSPTNDASLDGSIVRSANQLQLFVGAQPSGGAGLPTTYTVQVQMVAPLQTAETITERSSPTMPRVMVW